jgi:tRNA (guanine-N7-)-methyltransferase
MLSSDTANNLVIKRRRKLYKFARFDEMSNCFQLEGLLSKTGLACNLESWSERVGDVETSVKRATSAPNRARRGGGVSDAERPFERSFDIAGLMVVEIGAGTGLLSVELARRHPENFYIAVDIKSDRLYTGAKLATELGLENIVFLRGEISRLAEVIPQNSLNQTWITFPDPYLSDDKTRLKKSDAKHRLTHPRFLETYTSLLAKQNGELHFKTDNQLLFDWTRRQLEQSGWRIVESSRDLHSSDLPDDYKIKTSYETRFLEQGLPIYFLTATIGA